MGSCPESSSTNKRFQLGLFVSSEDSYLGEIIQSEPDKCRARFLFVLDGDWESGSEFGFLDV